MSGSKLHLNNDALTDHISTVFCDEVIKINEKYLPGQIKISLESCDRSLTKKEFQEHLASWVYSFRNPDKESVLAELLQA
jgi:hypothetical protein